MNIDMSAKLNRAPDSSKHIDHPASTIRSGPSADVIPLYRCCPILLFLDWLWRPWAYWGSGSSWVNFYSAAGVFWGSVCYTIASFASVTPAVYDSEVQGDCMGDTADWLQGFVFVLGDALWISAVAFQLIEALNLDYLPQLAEWEARGHYGQKPRYRWLGVRLGKLQWWGALSYVAGMILYLMGDVASLANDCPQTYLTDGQFLWVISYMNILAGFLFGVAGALVVMGEISPWLIPGIFPFSWAHARSLRFWGLCCFFYAGWLYCLASLQNYFWNPVRDWESIESSNIITGIGFGGGSLLYVAGAALLLARQARGRCIPACGRVGRLGEGCQPLQQRFNHDPSAYAAEDKV